MVLPVEKGLDTTSAVQRSVVVADGSRQVFWLLMLLAPALITVPPLLVGERLYLSTYTDDLFYYLKIAENILGGNGSTFNGIVDTNGYQPLWQLLMVVLEGISQLTGINIFALVALVMVGTGAWCLRELQLLAGSAASLLLLAGAYILYLNIALTGMEVAALVPLCLSLYRYIRTSNNLDWRLIGLLASLIVLMRLDAAVFVAIFLALSLATGFMTLADIPRFIAGGALLPVYLLVNLLVFGSIMPVSGAAKGVLDLQLVIHGWTFRSLFNYGLATSLMNVAMIVIWLVVGVLLIVGKPTGSRVERIWLTSCWLFVPVFYVQTALRSDWPIWRWYFYPLVLVTLCAIPRLSILVDAALLSTGKRLRQARYWVETVAAVSMVALFVFAAASHLLQKNTRHKDAEAIGAFVLANPGIYAMGDRAGLPAYLVKQPFVQLEGLVMDKDYLYRLETMKSIDKLLVSYDVSYYIGSPREQLSDTCYRMREPVYSQGYSRYVESKLCWPVVQTLSRAGGGKFLIFRNPYVTAGHDT